MKTHAIHVSGLILLGTGLLSCSPRYYVPNTQNVPLLREKGDLSLTLAASSLGELQGAYAVTSGFGVMFSGAIARPEDEYDGDGGRGSFAELGLGFFEPAYETVAFAAYGLLGIGSLENHFPSTLSAYPGTSGIIESRVTRYGMQASLGVSSRYFDVVLSTRVLSLHYHDVSGNLVFDGEDQVAYLRRENRHILVEPAGTFRAGIDFAKVQVQVGSSYNLSTPDFRQDSGHFSFGFVLYPQRRF